MRIGFAVAALVIAVPGVACAQGAAPQPPKAEKKVCRSEVPTGSIMPRSTCHTPTEWQAIDAANHAAGQGALDRESRLGGQAGR